jgi:hypothetical protein
VSGAARRYILEGYGHVALPDTTGTVDVDVKTWRPQGDLPSKMYEFFLGSAARLKDPVYAEIPDRKASALNRLGMLTESSGSVRFRCHAVLTDARLAKSKETVPVEVAKAINRSRTVEEILNNFRAAGSLPRRSAVSTALGRSSLVSTSLEGGIAYAEQSQSQREARVEAIVAGVRAKVEKKAAVTGASIGSTGSLSTLRGEGKDGDRGGGLAPLRAGTPKGVSARQRNRYGGDSIKEGDEGTEDEAQTPLLRK